MDDHYMTLGELRKFLTETKDQPDDMPVFYERIEDKYFDECGWETETVDTGYDGEVEAIRAFTAMIRENKFIITAHY